MQESQSVPWQELSYPKMELREHRVFERMMLLTSALALLRDTSKIKATCADELTAFMNEIGLQDSMDLLACTESQMSELAGYLKPLQATKFITFLRMAADLKPVELTHHF
jgi:hypothetical protein